MRRYPQLYEINARILIQRLSGKYRGAVTLATVPDDEWQFIARHGFDLVWLMGVWQRNEGSRQKALADPALRRSYDTAVPGWTEEDIAGSPYAIYDYHPYPALGKPAELAGLRSRLNRLGMGLVLDFVPNHVALDHPWTLSHPDWFVRGKDSDVRRHPGWFFQTGQGIRLAHGRDPNFPPWTDTAQLNFRSPGLRQALVNELLQIAGVCDGVRCDMAMLALNDTFDGIWGEFTRDYPRPEAEFWAEAISAVKRRHPGFLFLAEAYWGLEDRLLEQGFDFAYDKLLYDRLRYAAPGDISSYLMSDTAHQDKRARFIENHDEPRAVTAFGRERSLAAAVVTFTIPGLRLIHDGQLEGRRIRLPVQMFREPDEAPDGEVRLFYERLLAIISAPAFHEGQWQPVTTGPAWEGNESHHNLLAWSWHYGTQTRIVVVNYSAGAAQGRLKLPLPPGLKEASFTDELTGAVYVRDASEVSTQGLYVALEPYRAHILDQSPA